MLDYNLEYDLNYDYESYAKYNYLEMYMLDIAQLKEYQDELLEKKYITDREATNLLIIEQRFMTLGLTPFGVEIA